MPGITVAEEDRGNGDSVQAGNFGAIRVLGEYGSKEQRERFLTPPLSGDALMSVGVTGPDAGSAVAEIRSHVTRDGNGWRLNGTKVFKHPHSNVSAIPPGLWRLSALSRSAHPNWLESDRLKENTPWQQTN